MQQPQNKTISQICSDIDRIIAGEKVDYQYMFISLEEALQKGVNFPEMDLICNTIVKIAKTKNRNLRQLEKYFWDFANKVPYHMIFKEQINTEKYEELTPDTEYADVNKRILSRLAGLPLEIMQLDDDHSKGSDLRRSEALKLVASLLRYYQLPFAKKLFVHSIFSENAREKYEALQGLDTYFTFIDDELDDELWNSLDTIMENTHDRSVALTCLQIQVSAGMMDEGTVRFLIDDWRKTHEGS